MSNLNSVVCVKLRPFRDTPRRVHQDEEIIHRPADQLTSVAPAVIAFISRSAIKLKKDGHLIVIVIEFFSRFSGSIGAFFTALYGGGGAG